jgi:hypothetical protein
MWRTRFAGLVGSVALLGAVATPVAVAAPTAQHGGHRHGGWHHHHDDNPVVVIVQVPVPVPAPVPAPALAPPLSAAVPLPGAVPGPFPALQAAVQPGLQQLLPPAALQQNPLQCLPLQGNQYALINPVLFCGVDTAANCQAMAQQLAAVVPGFGSSLMNGPQGYGVYLTYQPSS